jgi:hypothetical protein
MHGIIQSLLSPSRLHSFVFSFKNKKQTFMKHSIFSALLIAGALFMSFNSAAAKNSTGNDQVS